MTVKSLAHITDRDLIDATSRAAADERRALVDLLALLGEVDARRLYLAEGYPSLFAYCTHALHFSEHEAYHRIEAARAARAFPIILERLREGALTLTSITLLRPHLVPQNVDELIAAASHKPKREVEQQMAVLAPKPDVKPVVRRLPVASRESDPPNQRLDVRLDAEVNAPSAPMMLSAPAPRSIAAPLCADRYLLRVTVSADAHANLQRARDLLRHSVPDGDPAAILERALELLVEDLERRRFGRTNRPKTTATSAKSATGDSSSRYVPAATRRAVWNRDEGRCAFVGRHGRCRETGGLEFHHVEPFALGGVTTVENLELRCRAHNQYEGAMLFGPRPGAATIPAPTRPGPS